VAEAARRRRRDPRQPIARIGLGLARGVALAAGSASAADSGRCRAQKLTAIAEYAPAELHCSGKTGKGGAEKAARCVAKIEARLNRALAKADATDDCALAEEEAGERAALRLSAGKLTATVNVALDPTLALCCQLADRCSMTITTLACGSIGGTPGEPGDLCGGTGSCVPRGYAEKGSCCLVPVYGCVGGDFSQEDCEASDGVYDEGLCKASGACE
jgi:hypothetical protein